MNTLTYVFIIALSGALILTPLVRRSALARNLVQPPTARGSHTEPKPRIGGIALYLSFILVGGLALNALFGWWWADPVAGLVMVPIIANEGYQALRGRSCGCSDGTCHSR